MNSKRTNRSNANSNTDRHDLRGQDFEFKDEFKNVNDSGLKHLIEDQKKQAEESRKSKDIQHPDQDIEELERRRVESKKRLEEEYNSIIDESKCKREQFNSEFNELRRDVEDSIVRRREEYENLSREIEEQIKDECCKNDQQIEAETKQLSMESRPRDYMEPGANRKSEENAEKEPTVLEQKGMEEMTANSTIIVDDASNDTDKTGTAIVINTTEIREEIFDRRESFLSIIKDRVRTYAIPAVVAVCVGVSAINVASKYVPALRNFYMPNISKTTIVDDIKIKTIKMIKTKTNIPKIKLQKPPKISKIKFTIRSIRKYIPFISEKAPRPAPEPTRVRGPKKFSTPEERPDTLELTALAEAQIPIELLEKISIVSPSPEDARLWKNFIEQKCNAMTYIGAPRSHDRFHVHNGVDIFAPEGTPVRAPFGGLVIFSGKSNGGYGGLVIIMSIMEGKKHYTLLGHLDPQTDVSIGDVVRAGDTVGRIGKHWEGSHLHVELVESIETIIESKKELPAIENGINKIGILREKIPKEVPSLSMVWDNLEMLKTNDKFKNPAGKFNNHDKKNRRAFVVNNFYKCKVVEEGRYKFPIEYAKVKDVSRLNRPLFQKPTVTAKSGIYKSFSHSSGE